MKIICIEDKSTDFQLIEWHLQKQGLAAECRRVESRPQLEDALRSQDWDLVLSDYRIPALPFEEILKILESRLAQLPVILVSGSVGEEHAVELLKGGIWDFVLKDNLTRLVPAIERSLQEAADRRARRQAEAALRENERLLRTVMDLVPHFIFAKDRHSRNLFVNRACAAASGLTPDQMVGLCDYDFVSNRSEAEAFMRDDREVIDSGRPKYIAEEPLTSAAGKQRVLQTTKIPFEAPGVGPALMGVAVDITELKQAEANLRRSEAEFRALFEVASVGMAQADPATGRWLRVNQKLCTITGYTQPELLAMHLSDLTHPEDREQDWALFQQVVRGEAPDYHIEKRYLRKGGAVVWVNVNMTVLRDASGQPRSSIAVIEDITERKQLEAQLRQAQKLEAIGQLAGGVAHDFNNILAAFLIQINLLQMKTVLDEETSRSLHELEEEAHRATNLTRQLLMFSRRSVLAAKPLDLNDVTASLLKMLRRLIGEDIDLAFEGKTALPLVEADAGMLEQVLMNLVVNARDAMPKGGRITIRTAAVDLSAPGPGANSNQAAGRFVCLTVSDTGSGMDAATLKRIFEPFFTTKEAGRGTGLGLATVHGIVGQHKGWVEVESEPGQGTTFRIYLPATTRTPAPAAPAAVSSPLPSGRETILLVEDEVKVRRLVGKALRTLGYIVHEAANGQQAVTLWDQYGPQIDLLFTDMVMPEGMTGLELTEKLQELKPGLRAIISSGYSAEIAQAGVLTRTGVVYLHKPYEAGMLAATVRECLDRKT